MSSTPARRAYAQGRHAARRLNSRATASETIRRARTRIVRMNGSGRCPRDLSILIIRVLPSSHRIAAQRFHCETTQRVVSTLQCWRCGAMIFGGRQSSIELNIAARQRGSGRSSCTHRIEAAALYNGRCRARARRSRRATAAPLRNATNKIVDHRLPSYITEAIARRCLVSVVGGRFESTGMHS